MRPLLLPTLLLLALTACQRDADIRPANYDELALATGHWEWLSTSYQAGSRTPATEGYARQLVFGPDGRLTLRRTSQPDYATSYQLAVAPGGISCIAAGSPTVTFTTAEAHLGNNDRKTYALSQQQGRQLLTLAGEQLCVDGGAFETYYWVAE